MPAPPRRYWQCLPSGALPPGYGPSGTTPAPWSTNGTNGTMPPAGDVIADTPEAPLLDDDVLGLPPSESLADGSAPRPPPVMSSSMAPPGTNITASTATTPGTNTIEPTGGEAPPADDTFLADAPTAPMMAAGGTIDPFTSTTPPPKGPPPAAGAGANGTNSTGAASATDADAPALDYYYDTPPNAAG